MYTRSIVQALIGVIFTAAVVGCQEPGSPIPDPEILPPVHDEPVVLLLISEYVEGSSNNKALEIANRGTTGIDMSRCRIDIYANGNTEVSYSIDLPSVVLAPSECLVIAHSGFTEPSMADLLSSWVNFNGDDALVLTLDDDTVDSFGRVGEDPGDAWIGAVNTTRDVTLRRKAGSTEDADPSDAFSPDEMWDGYATDDFSDLGS